MQPINRRFKALIKSLVASVALLPAIGFSQSFVTNGLVAYYTFNGNANDASGNGNNGTTQNVRFVTDRNGLPQGALSCPSNNSCVIVPNSTSLGMVSNITISAWINVASNQLGGSICDKGVVGSFWNYGFDVVSSGTNLTFQYDKSSGSAGPTGPLLSYGVWQQIAVAIDEPNNTIKFYVNGQLVTQPTIVLGGTFNPNDVSGVINDTGVNSGNLYLGNNNPNGLAGANFNGAIDDVRIYNQTLSDSEVQQLYQLENTPIVNLVKAVTVSFSNLSVGTNYQLQVSTDLNSWTNFGAPFTATNSFMAYSNYWNVSDWNQLFFRLQ
jgi:hypothetical protein